MTGMKDPRVFKKVVNQKEYAALLQKSRYSYLIEIDADMFYQDKKAVSIIPELYQVRGFSCIIEPDKGAYVGKCYLTNVGLVSEHEGKDDKDELTIGKHTSV